MTGHYPARDDIEFVYKADNLVIAVPTTKESFAYLTGADWGAMNFLQKAFIDSFDEMNAQGHIVVITGKDAVGNIHQYAGHKSDYNLMNIIQDDLQVDPIALELQTALLKSGNALEFCMKHGALQPVHFEKKTFTEEFLLEGIKRGTIKTHGIHAEECTMAMFSEAARLNPIDDLSSFDFDDFPGKMTPKVMEYQGLRDEGRKAILSAFKPRQP